MTRPPLLTIVLAAGKGVRMNSARPKVLHEVAGRSMLAHVFAAISEMDSPRVAVVIGPEMGDVSGEIRRLKPEAEVYVQEHQRGTADAVLAARPAIDAHSGDVMVLYADTPLISSQTLERLRTALHHGASVAVLGFNASEPAGYGRLLTDAGGDLLAIREHKDAREEERRIALCNAGAMAFRVADFADLLSKIGNDNAKNEFYLTDTIALLREDGHRAAVVIGEEDEVLGVNSREQLAAAEAVWQRRARQKVMRDGATLRSPETVWFSYDTKIGRDVTIEPNVVFGPDVEIEDGAEIKANCHITGAHIGRGATVGPFARLRPGSRLAEDAHIGNFVEVKNTTIGKGAKANHLAYLGDGDVGAKANIGAGTIFCNFDGFFKHKTEIGAGAFVGSNSSLVAPVRIGHGAYVGSGSVITRDVPSDSLALERTTQEERPGWAAKFRALMSRRKADST